MKTEQLLRALVADARPVRRLPKPSERCARWLGLALVLVALGASLGGLRPDLAEKARDVHFLAENAALSLVFVLASSSAFVLSVPGGGRSLATFSLPLLGWLLWLGLVLARASSGVAAGELVLAAPRGLPCVWRILALGLLPVTVAGAMLRRAAPLLQGWVGLFLSLSAFSLAAVGTQALCAIDEPRHLLWWHGLPLLLIGLGGACLGRVAFRQRAAPGSLPSGGV